MRTKEVGNLRRAKSGSWEDRRLIKLGRRAKLLQRRLLEAQDEDTLLVQEIEAKKEEVRQSRQQLRDVAREKHIEAANAGDAIRRVQAREIKSLQAQIERTRALADKVMHEEAMLRKEVDDLRGSALRHRKRSKSVRAKHGTLQVRSEDALKYASLVHEEQEQARSVQPPIARHETFAPT